MASGVYLLHFDQPYKHAKHYLGFAENIEERLARHRSGNGARLIEVITDAGIGFQLARVWENKDRHFERALKNRKYTSHLCPLCYQHPHQTREPRP